MTDIDSMHAALQLPAYIVLACLAAAFIARSYAIERGDITLGSARVVRINGYLWTIVAIKGVYWTVQRIGKATDLHVLSDHLDDGPIFAAACNVALIIMGAWLIAIITRDVFGRQAEWVAVSCVAILTVTGAIVVRGAGL